MEMYGGPSEQTHDSLSEVAVPVRAELRLVPALLGCADPLQFLNRAGARSVKVHALVLKTPFVPHEPVFAKATIEKDPQR